MKNSASDLPLKTALGWAATGVGIFLVANAIIKEFTRLDLKNKVVVITGGSRGFGLVLARHLAAEGARLAICARSADDLELARQELEASGAEVIAMTTDATENEEVKAMIRDVIQHYGRIDVLINNAGIIQVGPQQLRGVEEYRLAMQTNFWAQLYAMHAVIPHFVDRGQGRIVNITSIDGKIAIPHLLPHTASVGLSKDMHAALQKHNIVVTTVIPNFMRTGSPINVDVQGDYEKEYAWFKQSDPDSLPEQHPDEAARRIVSAIMYGESEVVLSLTGKVANLVKALAPGWVNMLMGFANRILPDAATGNRNYEAASNLPHGAISQWSDRASR